MSPAVLRKPQPNGEHDRGVVLFVSTSAGGLDDSFSVAAPVAERIGLGLVVPVKHGEASPVSQTIRDVESATVERLRQKGFEWGDVFRRRLDPYGASDSGTGGPRTSALPGHEPLRDTNSA